MQCAFRGYVEARQKVNTPEVCRVADCLFGPFVLPPSSGIVSEQLSVSRLLLFQTCGAGLCSIALMYPFFRA